MPIGAKLASLGYPRIFWEHFVYKLKKIKMDNVVITIE
jgi:hypothetical protein